MFYNKHQPLFLLTHWFHSIWTIGTPTWSCEQVSWSGWYKQVNYEQRVARRLWRYVNDWIILRNHYIHCQLSNKTMYSSQRISFISTHSDNTSKFMHKINYLYLYLYLLYFHPFTGDILTKTLLKSTKVMKSKHCQLLYYWTRSTDLYLYWEFIVPYLASHDGVFLLALFQLLGVRNVKLLCSKQLYDTSTAFWYYKVLIKIWMNINDNASCVHNLQNY